MTWMECRRCDYPMNGGLTTKHKLMYCESMSYPLDQLDLPPSDGGGGDCDDGGGGCVVACSTGSATLCSASIRSFARTTLDCR